MYDLLNQIEFPNDLRQLNQKQLPQLAHELRQFLIDSVSQTGGHLSSNLGTVELSIALHYVYNTPFDRLVWDVGHQTYAHKILTGRRKNMHTLRKQHGVSGFPRREESEYDTFGVGHSSTSISSALGMAVASQHENQDRKVVAIIGDGAMTAGMAFEALNNAGALDANLLVILNDNEMSISPNVGALKNYLAKLLSGKFYNAMIKGGEKMLSPMPNLLKFAKRTEEHVLGLFTGGTLFEELGFNYIGPIDGHDVDLLVKTLTNLKEMKGPQFLHIVTKKGKGFQHAEDDPCLYHGVSQFDPKQGLSQGKSGGKISFTQVFSDWLCDMAEIDKRLMGVTPAMREGSGLVAFSEQYPDRYYDVGIAEQHAVTFAGGLACEGYKPVVAIYSTFLQRAYDQLIHDIAIQNLPVVFAIDRAGIVGPDGATHGGFFDLSYLRCIPNMIIMTPSDENECRQMLYTAFQQDCPTAVRYPRGSGIGATIQKEMTLLPIGKAKKVRDGERIAICSFGTLLDQALIAGNELNATVVDMRFVKPLDKHMIASLLDSHELIVTLEDNALMGGAGSAVLEYCSELNSVQKVLLLGLSDVFLEHGERNALLAQSGLDSKGIVDKIQQKLK